MKDKKLRNILRKKVNKITELCEDIAPDFDKEQIHEFRTQLKRLRSLLRLINTGLGKPVARIPKKFKRLYRITGIIREAQLEMDKLAEWKIKVPVYTTNLENLIGLQKKAWEKHYNKKVLRRFKKKIVKKHVASLSPRLLGKFFRNRIHGISTLAHKKLPDNGQVHSMRKEVKDLMYNAMFAGKNWEKAYNKIEKYPLGKLDRLATDIGDYNDTRIILEHIASFSSPGMPRQERERLNRLVTVKGKHRKAEKKKVLAAVRKFTAAVSAA